MKFQDLSESAKDTVRVWQQEGLDNWYEDTIAEWKATLGEKGFADAEIFFSGFSCQGDGASFTANVNRDLPKQLQEAIALWNQTTGPGLARLLGELESFREAAYECCVRITRSDHYHKYTMDADVEVRAWDMPEDLDKQIDDWTTETRNALLQEARDLADEIYAALETEWDNQNSDDYIAETAEANDWEFDEDGELIERRRRKAA